MAILDNILNRFGFSRTIVAPQNEYMNAILNKVGIVQNETISAVFKCIDTIATHLSILPQQVLKGSQLFNKHPLSYILAFEPNAWQNPQAFTSQLIVHFLFYGNAFRRIHRNNFSGQIEKFTIMHPYWIVGYNFIEGELYYYIDHSKNPDTPREDLEPVHSSEICHYKDISFDGIFGISKMQAANDNAQILGKAAKTLNTFYDNHAHTTLVLEGKIEPGIDASILPEIQKSQSSFSKKHGGRFNAGEVIETPWNKKLTSIPVNYIDVQLIETMKFTRDQVYTVFSLVDFFKEGNNNDIEQQLLAHKNHCLLPIGRVICIEDMFKMLSNAEKLSDINIAFNYRPMLDADLKTLTTAYRMQVTAGLASLNEGINALGNKPMKSEHGDAHYIQQQNHKVEEYDEWKNMGKNGTPNNTPPKTAE